VRSPTFFGGTIAIADLGVIEMCCGLGSLSPFSERLIAYSINPSVSQGHDRSYPANTTGQPTFISAI